MVNKQPLLSVLLLTILISGCFPSDKDISTDRIIPSPSANPSEKDPYDLTESAPCLSDYLQVSTAEIVDYEWSEENNFLYFSLSTEPGKTLAYSVKERLVVEYPADSPRVNPTPEKEKVTFVAQGKGSLYDYYYSPDQKMLLFTTISKADVPTPTKNIEGETFTDKPLIQDLYLLDTDQESSSYLGKLEGLIQQVLWSEDGSKAVIDMGFRSPVPLGPDYLYIIDTLAPKLAVLKPRNENDVPPIPKAISPDGMSLVIAPFEKDDSWKIINTQTGNEDTVNLPPQTFLLWFLDNDHVLIVFRQEDMSWSVALHDLPNQKMEKVYAEDLAIHPWTSNPASLSYNKKHLAIVDANSFLHVLSLCPVNR